MFDTPICYWIQMSSDCNWTWPQNHLVRKQILSGSGFESNCSMLQAGSSWHSGNYRVRIHSATHPWHDKNMLPNVKVWYTTKLHIRFKLKIKKIKIEKTLYNGHSKDTKHRNCISKKALLVLPWSTNTQTKKHFTKAPISKKHLTKKSAHNRRAHDFY